MSDKVLYHNPRWGKSRKAVLLLEQNNIDFKIVEYLKNPLSVDEIFVISEKLDKRPKDFIRRQEGDFKENNIISHIDNDKKLALCIEKFPKIMERPIFVNGNKAIIGRPPENVLSIL